MSHKMRYDSQEDILMIWLAEGKPIDHAEQVGNSILHLSAEDEPLLLEVLNAREFVLDLMRAVLNAAPETTTT